jgi:hypothetical protein
MAADFDALAARIGAAVLPVVRSAARRAVMQLQAAAVTRARFNLLDQGARDTGETLRGIQATEPVETTTGYRGEVRATAPQSIFVERGRRANKPMPPGGALLGWMSRHGIPANREFVIRRAIGRRGIKARPFMAPLPTQLEPMRQQILAQARETVRQELARSLQGL